MSDRQLGAKPRLPIAVAGKTAKTPLQPVDERKRQPKRPAQHQAAIDDQRHGDERSLRERQCGISACRALILGEHSSVNLCAHPRQPTRIPNECLLGPGNAVVMLILILFRMAWLLGGW